MTTLDQITAMVAAGESDTLEFKSTTGTRREAAATVCAMLNQRGGHVLFGVTPEGGAVGQQVSERTVEALSAELGRIDPPVFPTVERIPVGEGREIVVVAVNPGPARPYQYRDAAYRRVGNTTLAMPTEEYNRVLLERMHNEQRWENQPAVGWSVADPIPKPAVRIHADRERGNGLRANHDRFVFALPATFRREQTQPACSSV